MTSVNADVAGKLLGFLTAWADLTPETLQRLYPQWDPAPETYEADLEHFVRSKAIETADRYHPEGLELIKGAMRWVLAEAPGYADEWYDASLCGLDHPPEPRVKLWRWAWDAVFGDEPWDVEGETFEIYLDEVEARSLTKEGWPNRAESSPRAITWPWRR